ncbi:hypothetical protein AGMMS49928_02820 [Spirochaetia bacterium]|nr:hypothetical protein AGMMS49928_02820 [Spirochaetia bacterium]
MSIRGRIISSIIIMSVLIITVGIWAGFMFTQKSVTTAIEQDMRVVAETADRLVSAELKLLKSDVSAAAMNIMNTPSEALHQELMVQVNHYKSFLSLTVLDKNGVVDFAGKYPAAGSFLDSAPVRRAFAGDSIVSTTTLGPDGADLIFYVSVPMGQGFVLAAAVDGMYFCDVLGGLKVWNTGYVFIDDAEGVVIAHENRDWVRQRHSFIEIAKTDAVYVPIAEMTTRMIQGKAGMERILRDREERFYTYQPVSGSLIGWTLCVTAPFSESPLEDTRAGFLLVGLVCFVLCVIAAFAASLFIEKPYAAAARMVTELTAAREEALAGTEAKSRFLANMSHEMRTPLNAIIGLSEIALDADSASGGSSAISGNLEKIYKSGVTLLGIINGILDMSKIESGKFEIISANYELSSLINDAVTTSSVHIAGKPVDFRLKIDPSLPSRLIGDDLRIKQMLNNLLSNAFKYTKEGFVEWNISHEREDDKVWLNFDIRDSGIGITEESLEKLFSDYSQADTRGNREIEGTGLGLAITKRMAQMMGGDVTVKSEYGKGSVFSLRICQGFVTEEPIGAEVAGRLMAFKYSEHRRAKHANLVRAQLPYASVLVVDDVFTNLDVVKGLMKPYGMRVDCASGGMQAIEMIRKQEIIYDAIFMDHMMPGMDGIETVRIIREEIGTDYAKNIPIIALTANAIVGNEEMFLQKGFQAFLSKPIDILRLDAALNRWVRNKEKEDEMAASPKLMDENNVISIDELKDECRKIEHFDADGGLKRFGDDAEMYLDVLKSYARNTPPLLETIDSGDPADVADYAVIVHGIKSSSRSIGADELGDMAEKLEHSSRAGDFVYVNAHHGEFMRAAGNLIMGLNTVLARFTQDGWPVKAVPDEAVLAALKNACENFDMDGVDTAMEELGKYTYESGGDLVDWLQEQVKITGFKQIVERLS